MKRVRKTRQIGKSLCLDTMHACLIDRQIEPRHASKSIDQIQMPPSQRGGTNVQHQSHAQGLKAVSEHGQGFVAGSLCPTATSHPDNLTSSNPLSMLADSL
ncbi:hypothetical protein ACXIUS_18975 [Bosea thiooxidans]|nr:hypothetical protein [Bosea sp. (in: a-proteobacteria)]